MVIRVIIAFLARRVRLSQPSYLDLGLDDVVGNSHTDDEHAGVLYIDMWIGVREEIYNYNALITSFPNHLNRTRMSHTQAYLAHGGYSTVGDVGGEVVIHAELGV